MKIETKLKKLKETLENRLQKLKIRPEAEVELDRGFIDFVLEDSGLKDAFIDSLPPLDKKSKAIHRTNTRKMREKMKKIYGNNYHYHWDNAKKAIKHLKKLDYLVSEKLGHIAVIEPPRNKRMTFLHRAVFILREYFIELTGNPQWGSIADIVNPYYEGKGTLTYDKISNMRAKRKKDYEIFNGKTFMLLEYNFYKRHKK